MKKLMLIFAALCLLVFDFGVRAEAVKVATVSMDVDRRNVGTVVYRMTNLIERAAEKGAKLIVFPAGTTTGISPDRNKDFTEAVIGVRSAAEAARMSEKAVVLKDDPVTKAIIELAEENNIYIAYTLYERERTNGRYFYNTAVLVGPKGIVGTQRKVHLPGGEQVVVSNGDNFKVFNTEIGRIGMQVGYDVLFPESSRVQAINGANIILGMTAFPATDLRTDIKDERLKLLNGAASSNALANGVFFVTANAANPGALGNSAVFSPRGQLMTSTGFIETMVFAELGDVAKACTEARYATGSGNDLLKDLQPEVYTELVRSGKETKSAFGKYFKGEPVKVETPKKKLLPFEKDKIRIGVANMDVDKKVEGRTQFERVLDWVDKAAAKGCDLIVFPKGAHYGIAKPEKDDNMSILQKKKAEMEAVKRPAPVLAENNTDVQALIKKAKEKKIYIVFNTVEANSEKPKYVYNVNLFIGPEGIIGKHHEVHLKGSEPANVLRGNGFDVFETPFGCVGMQASNDMIFPESTRVQMLRGANIIIGSTAISADDMMQRTNDTNVLGLNNHFASIARLNNEFIVASHACSRGLLGHSAIYNPAGEVLASSGYYEGLVVTDIANPKQECAKGREKVYSGLNPVKDRHPEAYADLVEVQPGAFAGAAEAR